MLGLDGIETRVDLGSNVCGDHFGRPLKPLAALSKRSISPVSVKFWRWPRMPLQHYLDRGPNVASIERFGKFNRM